MSSKKRSVLRKANKKHSKKVKSAKRVKSQESYRKTLSKKPSAQSSQGVLPPSRIEPPAIERTILTIGTIRGDTAIGDLLVAFPRTRDVLVRKGLRLEAEDAGDIYMTLDAFSAMNGLKTENLVLDIVEVAKESLPQPPVSQLVAAPAT